MVCQFRSDVNVVCPPFAWPIEMKTKQIIAATFVAVIATGIVMTAQVSAKEFDLQNADVHGRMHAHDPMYPCIVFMYRITSHVSHNPGLL